MLLIRSDISGVSGDMLLCSLVHLTGDKTIATSVAKEIEGICGFCHQIEIEFKELRDGIRLNLNVDENRASLGELKKCFMKVAGKFLRDEHLRCAVNAFEELISVETKIHGVEEIHELASVDTVLDIVAVNAYFNKLGGDVFFTAPKLGSGTVKCEHGEIAVPVPAVEEICKSHKIPIYIGGTGELTTPTGISILANGGKFVESFLLPSGTIAGRGYGIREIENNFIEAYVCQDSDEVVSVLTACIDDITPEVLSGAAEELRQEVIDLYITPIYMKKSRTAWKVEVLCILGKEREVAEKVMKSFGTLGVRVYTAFRIVANRRIEERKVRVSGREFELRVKISDLRGTELSEKVEYEDLIKISSEINIPLRNVEREVYRCLKSGKF